MVTLEIDAWVTSFSFKNSFSDVPFRYRNVQNESIAPRCVTSCEKDGNFSRKYYRESIENWNLICTLGNVSLNIPRGHLSRAFFTYSRRSFVFCVIFHKRYQRHIELKHLPTTQVFVFRPTQIRMNFLCWLIYEDTKHDVT